MLFAQFLPQVIPDSQLWPIPKGSQMLRKGEQRKHLLYTHCQVSDLKFNLEVTTKPPLKCLQSLYLQSISPIILPLMVTSFLVSVPIELKSLSFCRIQRQ